MSLAGDRRGTFIYGHGCVQDASGSRAIPGCASIYADVSMQAEIVLITLVIFILHILVCKGTCVAGNAQYIG